MSKPRKRVAALLLAGTLALMTPSGTFAEEIWVAPSPIVPASLDFPWPTTGSGFVSFGFAIPNDMGNFVGATVALLPGANVADAYDVYAEVKRDGETISFGSLAISLGNPANLVDGEIQDVDISGIFAGLFDATSPGNDYASVFFWFPTGQPAADTGRILGLRFIYDAVPAGTADIANNAVTSAKLAANSVNSSKVVDNSLTAADLAGNSVGASEIQTGAVGSLEIATNAVSSSKVADNSLTASDLAANSVGSSEIATNAVGSSEVADNSLTASDLGTNSVGASEIATNAVGAAEIATNAVGALEIATNAVGAAEIAAGAVRGSEITTIRVVSVECNGECGDSTLTQVCNATGSGFEPLMVDCSNVDEDNNQDIACPGAGDNRCFVNTVFSSAPLSSFCDDVSGWDAQVYCISTQ